MRATGEMAQHLFGSRALICAIGRSPHRLFFSEQLFDHPAESLWLCGWSKSVYYIAMAIDQKLGEIPLDTLATEQASRLFLQPSE
jgi:hypothetical protein